MEHRPYRKAAVHFMVSACLLVGTHVGVTVFCKHPLIPSNILQVFAPIAATVVCFWQTRLAKDAYMAKCWRLLSGAFAMWSLAQSYFVFALLTTGHMLDYPSGADVLWMAFALPILLLVTQQRASEHEDWIRWFDAGQAAIFFSLLCMLVFDKHLGITVAQAYGVQSIALVLLAGLRYARVREPAETVFFKNLGIYLAVYGVFSSLAYHIEAMGWDPGSFVDLCWSLPPLIFVILTALRPPCPCDARADADDSTPDSPVHHLYATSTVGLFVLSIATGGFLYQKQRTLGVGYLAASAIIFFTRMVCREHELFMAHSSLKRSYTHDSLTGLANRQWMDRHAHLFASREVVLCSMDRFKLLNDTYGRPAMDQVLVALAQRFRAVPGISHLFRVGGDEFVFVVPVDGTPVVEILTREIKRPVVVQDRTIELTATIGRALFAPEVSFVEALKHTELAVMHGKRTGRNQVVTFQQQMQSDSGSVLAFEAALKAAINNGAIQNFYQPIYAPALRRIVGVEALARWVVDGMVVATPDRFIPIAENTGLIVDLGRTLLSKACSDVVTLSKAAGMDIWVSINLSARQFQDAELLDHLTREIARNGISPQQIKLEVTESVLIDEVSNARDILQSARALGVAVALDDFGTGYSSLSYLIDLPFDLIKIDRSFIQTMHLDAKRSAVVKTIIQLARDLQKQVVAEGIEESEQQRELEAMGCCLLQGYKFSKPLSLESIVSVFSQNSAEAQGIVTPSLKGNSRVHTLLPRALRLGYPQ